MHASLMPDYNRRAGSTWWLVIVLGGAALSWALVDTAQRGPEVAAQVAAALLLAVLAALFPVRMPSARHGYSAGDILIFLVLLALGPAPAAVVAAMSARPRRVMMAKVKVISPISARPSRMLMAGKA